MIEPYDLKRDELEPEQERELIKYAQEGNKNAVNDLLGARYGTIYNCATKVINHHNVAYKDYDDVYLAALEGYVEGIMNFDLERKTVLNTFAIWRARSYARKVAINSTKSRNKGEKLEHEIDKPKNYDDEIDTIWDSIMKYNDDETPDKITNRQELTKIIKKHCYSEYRNDLRHVIIGDISQNALTRKYKICPPKVKLDLQKIKNKLKYEILKKQYGSDNQEPAAREIVDPVCSGK